MKLRESQQHPQNAWENGKKKQRKQKKNYRKREIDICKDLRIKWRTTENKRWKWTVMKSKITHASRKLQLVETSGDEIKR